MSHPVLFIAAIAAAALPGQAAAAGAPQLLGAVQAAAAATAPKPVLRADVIRDTGNSFQEVDTNKDGSWSKAEIDAAQARAEQRAAGQMSQRMQQEFNKLDTDKNGQLSLAEFRAATPTVRGKPGASSVAMQRLDTNKDGKVTLDEYRAPVLAGFDRIDTNKDGTVSLEERNKAAAAQTAGR